MCVYYFAQDALTLQRVCLEKKQELSADDDDNVPDVPALLQELMVNLFISTHNCTVSDREYHVTVKQGAAVTQCYHAGLLEACLVFVCFAQQK